MFDYSKLRGLIREKLKSESKYAELMNLSLASVSGKLNSQTPFSLSEIDKTIELLNIDTKDIYEYFFTKKVEKNSTNNIEENVC